MSNNTSHQPRHPLKVRMPADPLDHDPSGAEPTAPEPKPRQSWKSRLAIGLIAMGIVATFLWIALLGTTLAYVVFAKFRAGY